MNAIDGFTHRRVTAARLAAATLIALMIAACGSPATSTTPPKPTESTTPASPTATTKATSTASGPMSGDELVWLDGIGALHKAMDTVPPTVTMTTMRSLARQLAGCTRTLDGLGAPTDRLRSVYRVAAQGCARYQDASRCFATAASLGIVVAGSAAERKQTEAVNCGFADLGDGSKLFAEAEIAGIDIKEAAR